MLAQVPSFEIQSTIWLSLEIVQSCGLVGKAAVLQADDRRFESVQDYCNGWLNDRTVQVGAGQGFVIFNFPFEFEFDQLRYANGERLGLSSSDCRFESCPEHVLTLECEKKPNS